MIADRAQSSARAMPAQNGQALRSLAMNATSLLISTLFCSLVVIAFTLSSTEFHHWFVLPVLGCGILIGVDAVDWIRGKVNVFDPVGIIGVLGVHFFFLAPLLHVYWNFWLYARQPLDTDSWRPWLGWMALLNFLGIMSYRMSRGITWKRRRKPHVTWQLDPKALPRLLIPSLLLTGVLQILIYAKFGGIVGYINNVQADEELFRGMGWLLLIAESFPILFFIGFAVAARSNPRLRRWIPILCALGVFLILKLLFGGLRGSRSNTVWGLFFAVGVVHLWIRPVPKRFIAFGLALLVAFMYLYSFYEAYGMTAIDAIGNRQLQGELQQQSDKSLPYTLLEDLGRSDMQAYTLFRIESRDSSADYHFAWGRTYLGALAKLIPAQIWPDRPPAKVKESSELMIGPGAYDAGILSSRVFGLAGEAMLNFGPLAVPLAFIPLGLLIGWVRRRLLSWDSDDSRMLFIPILINLCFIVLIGDSDNTIFFIVKNGALPFIVVAAASRSVLSPSVRPALGKLRAAHANLPH